jgi:hypothetical protein
MAGLLIFRVLAIESVLLQGEECASSSCVACMPNSATFDFQNRLINFYESVREASHEASGIGTMFDDFGELDNIVI